MRLHICTAALLGASTLLHPATRASAQSAAPPAGAGYVLPDGSIRVIGPAELRGVITQLNALYTQQHPGTRFTYIAANNTAAVYSLTFDATPFAPITTFFPGSLTYGDIAHGPAFSIRMAHASLAPGAALSPYAVVVHPDNPITRISVGELASIFTQPMRQPVLSHWSQLKETASLGDRAIVPCGLPWSDHYTSEDTGFSDELFTRRFANAPPVDTYKGLPTYAQAVAFAEQEPGAICIVAANQVTPGVKAVAVVDSIFGKPQFATAASIAAGRYPLDRYAYINVHAITGKPLDPFALAYLRMVLSPEGQKVIAAEASGFVPLNATEAGEELGKLD